MSSWYLQSKVYITLTPWGIVSLRESLPESKVPDYFHKHLHQQFNYGKAT